MSKESVIRSTIIFILSAIMIFVSVRYLGHNNLMVGVSGLFILIAILNKDFSRTPFRSGLKVLFLTLIMGGVPYFINANVFSGFFINFIAVFVMIYMVVYTFNKTIYFPFLFGYTLLLTSNVTGRDLTLRVLGMIGVAIIAVTFQILYIKYKQKKEVKNRVLLELIESLRGKIELAVNGKFSDAEVQEFKRKTGEWSREILEIRNNTTYLSEKENLELDLIASLENIAHMAKGFSDKNQREKINYTHILSDINILLIELKEFINGESNIKYLRKEVNRISRNYELSNIDYDVEIYEVLEVLKIMDRLTYRLVELENIKRRRVFSIRLIFKEIKSSIIESFNDFNINSVRFIFAFRTALLVAGCYFLLRYFDYPLAKWSLFTITSVSQVYNDTVRERAKGRFLGTVIGVVIYVPLAMIFTAKEPRIIIIAIAVFLMISFKKYMYSIAMLTILFIGIVTINIENMFYYGPARIMYIVIGIIAVLIANKFVFPYNLKKETKLLIDKYQDTCLDILNRVFDLHSKKSDVESMKNDIILAKSIESKIIANDIEIDPVMLQKYRMTQRLFLNKIHNILNRIEYVEANPVVNVKDKMEKLWHMSKELEYIPLEDEDILNVTFNKYINGVQTIEEKIIYLDVFLMIKLNKESDITRKKILALI